MNEAEKKRIAENLDQKECSVITKSYTNVSFNWVQQQFEFGLHCKKKKQTQSITRIV